MDNHDRAAALTAFEAAYWVNVKDPNAPNFESAAR